MLQHVKLSGEMRRTTLDNLSDLVEGNTLQTICDKKREKMLIFFDEINSYLYNHVQIFIITQLIPHLEM